MSEENDVTLVKNATRFGWNDFILNLLFSMIMITSFVVFVFLSPDEDIDLIFLIFYLFE